MRARLIALVLLGTASPVTLAQPRDHGHDERERRSNKREQRDDRRDVREIEELLARFDAAHASRDRAQLGRIDSLFWSMLEAELRESEREQWRRLREVEHERREVRRDRWDKRPLNEWDDRQDLRDDRRDLRREVFTAEQVKHLMDDWRALWGRTDRTSFNRKRGVLSRYLGMARRELGEDRREAREDRHERREDRHEWERGSFRRP